MLSMRVACVHVLPLEYYPPATNLLRFLSAHTGWRLKAWSTENRRDARRWQAPDVEISRPKQSSPSSRLASRMAGYLWWHASTAIELLRWNPDVVLSVEPHSALAVWIYYLLGGKAALFIHHHEYYALADFDNRGMRVLRTTFRRERDDLFPRAAWISQTNEQRLRLLMEWNRIRNDQAHVLPNYPPHEWVQRARTAAPRATDSPTRFLYLGSASLDNTFIGEFAEWIVAHPSTTTLHVVGNNIADDVWRRIYSLNASNISADQVGWDYDDIPGELSNFDVGLVLYRGRTQNFVYNVPNKTIEYLAGGLEVWYPPQMEAMRDFHLAHTEMRLREVDFEQLPENVEISPPSPFSAFPFTAEAAIAPLVKAIENQTAG